MGQIVPDAVERYLAGLNRAGDAVLGLHGALDRQHRDVRDLDEVLEPRLGIVGIGVETENDAGGDLQAVIVQGLDRFHHRHGDVLVLAHRLERVSLRRLDAHEDADK